MTDRDRVYLVGFVDTTKKPPQLRSAGIFSEPGRHLTRLDFTEAPVEILDADGATLEEARRTLHLTMLSPIYAWVIPLLRSSDKRLFEVFVEENKETHPTWWEWLRSHL